jgi:magnesium-protoporphyrin O-methyltransferase
VACHCGRCATINAKFGPSVAEDDLARYHRRGPDDTTRLLLDQVRSRAAGASLLDIGGGIGVIAHELLGTGAAQAIVVEAADAYRVAAESEAERRGTRARLSVLTGDFVDLSDHVAPADVVTLDRVVCCYPDAEALLSRAADRTRAALALSYPRDRWYVRLVIGLQNLMRRLAGQAFRTFVHSPDRMSATLARGGLRCVARQGTMVWQVETWTRRPERASEPDESTGGSGRALGRLGDR